MKTLDFVSPPLAYEKGFVVDRAVLPFYSFQQPNETAHWSSEMTEFIAEASRDHFIDRYNRAVVLEGIAPALTSPANYLDIGCASGYMIEEVAAAHPAARVNGSDFFSAGLLLCHKRMPDAPLFQMDITSCPFKDSTFEAISCLNVLEHISDDLAALRTIHRILKPGGRGVFTVPAGPDLYDFNDEVHFHVRRYTLDEFREKITEAGFNLLRANFFGVFIYPAFVAQKRINQWLFKTLSPDEKQHKAHAQAVGSGRFPGMDSVCSFERWLGRQIRYPFGIRLYAIVTK